ncbi:MAG: CAP domain-containing protein [Chloroflexota bacterium]
MAGTKTARNLVRGVLVAASLFVLSPPSFFARANAARRVAADCPAVAQSTDPTVAAGRPYLGIAYTALTHDRARFAGLGPLQRSTALSVVAERHSSYMASIGSWSDGDPAGTILDRVQAAGVQATYAGQNVVTSNGDTVDQAIQTGEAFFAREANGGGPHWDNITNPNHHAVGIGISLLGSPGSYTIYLTQVFADNGGCGAPSEVTFSDASSTKSSLHVGLVVRPTVDDLQLRSEPKGLVIGQVTSHDRLKVLELDGSWAQVHVMKSNTFGWVFTAFVAAS